MTVDKVLKYESPKLTAYGSVAELTAATVKCTGIVHVPNGESLLTPNGVCAVDE